MTTEERAKIARENGAKSHGPKTEEGKARSSRNALKDGDHAAKLSHFVPPHEAILCNESREDYETLVEELVAIYKPQNQAAFAVVGDMASARWQLDRLNRCITMQWNLALINAGKKPNTLAPELHELKVLADASAELLSGNGVLPKLNREIARLQQVLARAERRVKFIHANFPDFAPARPQQTQPPEEAVIANTELTPTQPEECEENEPPLFVTENVPSVIAAYKNEFPGRRIVILPPDNVAKGIDREDNMPRAPRKVA
ncbi:MAG: hypothetical protein ACKV2U_11340, partial [Bryobacteraceae bacterium]